MRYPKVLAASLLVLPMMPSCKKDRPSSSDCFPGSRMVRQLTDAPATVKKSGEKYFIIEQGSIDSKLNPCELPAAFRVDNLPVIISGTVQSTIQAGPGPCCTENFIITKISR